MTRSRSASYWLRDPAPDGVADPPLAPDERVEVDVAIIGGGFTGLWTAIALTDTDPSLRVVVLEMETIAFGASGRNGGFCEASLTHGLANGIRHFPDELERLEREGIDNLRALIAFTREHGIDCDLEETGVLALADQPLPGRRVPRLGRRGRRAWRAPRVPRPRRGRRPKSTRRCGMPVSTGHRARLLVDPAKLCRGIARVARERGVRIHEGTRVTEAWSVGPAASRFGRRGPAMVVADQVVVATSAYSGWLPRLASTFVPVYDYALVSDPLTPDQRDAIGWRRRQGLPTRNNQFHYFRLTADDRILWGGYDAIHHRGSRVGPELDRRPADIRQARGTVLPGFPAA